jgi:hypothetical protein
MKSKYELGDVLVGYSSIGVVTNITTQKFNKYTGDGTIKEETTQINYVLNGGINLLESQIVGKVKVILE